MEASRVLAGKGTLTVRFLSYPDLSYSLTVNHEWTKGTLSGPGKWLKAAKMSTELILHLEDGHAIGIRLTKETGSGPDTAQFELTHGIAGWM
jgi:hypothetical protein